MLIDSHLHFEDRRLLGDVPKFVGNFEADGVDFVINASCDEKTQDIAIGLAEKYENIYTLIGNHPHEAKFFNDSMRQKMNAYANHPKVVGVGEIGLDFFYDHSPRDVQRAVFAEQLQMADSFGLPVALHVREAYNDTLQILGDNKQYLNNGILLHCYSGSREMVREFGKFDCYFAFGGAVTFKNAKKDDVINAVPIDRILTETDSPYLTPEPYRGRTNQPAYVRYVLDKIAAVRGKETNEMEEIVRQNTLRLFKRIKR